MREWKRDVLVGFSPLEAGLGEAIDFGKPRFVGRDALVRERRAGPRWRFAALLVEASQVDPLVAGSVFLGDRPVGMVTSGGFGHRIGSSIALCYVHPECAVAGMRLDVDILGERVPARVAEVPLYQCAGRRAE